MDFSNFNLTPSAKAAIQECQLVAKKFKHLKVIDLHLIFVILSKDNANINYSLNECSINHQALLFAFGEVLASYKEPRRKKKIYAPEIFEILEGAESFAKISGHSYIGIDHILLTILNIRDEIAKFLKGLEIDVDTFLETLENCISKGFEPASTSEKPSPKKSKEDDIESCCENLNLKIAKRGTFEIFGRDKEIERAFEILLRKNKSNIIFVGDAGVGKTAIVEGMAEKIVQRNCPDLLLHKQILTLDITSVISGTVFRGQMEEKMKNILKYIIANPQYILFIDEVHTIIGSGSSEGGLDLANILKPALSRGEISCIGATTKEEYKRYFKKDSALDRRFENININEPSEEDTKALLMKAKFAYEKYHLVSYPESTIDLIIDLCSKYVPEKKFPDKAFDILDESGAKTKKNNVIRPKKARDMESKFDDKKFVKSKEFEAYHKKYQSILTKWGKKIEKLTFEVDKDVIYDIFALKLETTPKNIKTGKNFRLKGTIGF